MKADVTIGYFPVKGENMAEDWYLLYTGTKIQNYNVPLLFLESIPLAQPLASASLDCRAINNTLVPQRCLKLERGKSLIQILKCMSLSRILRQIHGQLLHTKGGNLERQISVSFQTKPEKLLYEELRNEHLSSYYE